MNVRAFDAIKFPYCLVQTVFRLGVVNLLRQFKNLIISFENIIK
jgi:hypothetical protein